MAILRGFVIVLAAVVAVGMAAFLVTGFCVVVFGGGRSKARRRRSRQRSWDAVSAEWRRKHGNEDEHRDEE